MSLQSPPTLGRREAEYTLTDSRGRSCSFYVHEPWRDAFPWLVQGTTGRSGESDFDLGLAGAQPVAQALGRWWTIRETLRAHGIVLSRQVHGRTILSHAIAFDGLHLNGPADGHTTTVPGLLLSVSVADCVPVFVIDAAARNVMLLHAGWRGTAAGILEAGLAMLAAHAGDTFASVHMHFGPSICAQCYPVGTEVLEALDLPVQDGPQNVDLRGVLAQRALDQGVPARNISRSAWCTRCDRSRFFSHRGGDAGRQAGFLGLRTLA